MPAKEQDYPWRGAFDPALANTKESNLQQTTPVNMHPDGATPAGIFDLAGNVWEWTANKNEKYDDAFRLKGGAWYWGTESAMASAAIFQGRWERERLSGFRVVVVPVSWLVLGSEC